MRLDRTDKRITDVCMLIRLAERTRLSRGTIYNSVDRLTKAGWYEEQDGKPNAIVYRTIKQKGWVTPPSLRLKMSPNRRGATT